MEEIFRALSQAVIDGRNEECERFTRELLDRGVAPKDVLDRGLVPGMDVVGVRFRDNLIFVPEVLISARAMKASLSILEPLLAASNVKEIGTFVIGTVKGDIPDIGKNIVAMMLRGAGFRVVDLGIDTRAETFVDAVRRERADILGMSALLTTTMGYMKTVVDRLKSEGVGVKTMVGGAPLSQAFAEKIGADAYARNAAEAVEKARALLRDHVSSGSTSP